MNVRMGQDSAREGSAVEYSLNNSTTSERRIFSGIGERLKRERGGQLFDLGTLKKRKNSRNFNERNSRKSLRSTSGIDLRKDRRVNNRARNPM